MTLSEIHEADMTVILGDAGNTFTWDGTDYACILADIVKDKELHEGGFLPDYDLAIHTKVALFGGGLPEPGDQVTVNGSNYRVLRSRRNFTGAILVLDLATIEK